MTCLYPGTFDPITNGHLDVIKRALNLFDKVIVAIAKNEEKRPYFSLDKRKELANIATQHLDGVEVITFDFLLVDLVKQMNIDIVVRGLRTVSDFEYEIQINYVNNTLWKGFETIFLMPSLKNAFISSSIVRSVAEHGGDVSGLVPKAIIPYMKDTKCL